MHIHITTPDDPTTALFVDEFGIDALGGPADGGQIITVGTAPFTALAADCVVGGGNAFGFLDGADYPLLRFFGWGLQERINDHLALLEATFSEVPIGHTAVIDTGSKTIPHLIWAPYARLPISITDPITVMLAARAAVYRASQWPVERLWLPAMGIGAPYGLHPSVAARAMRSGIQMGLKGKAPRPVSWRDGLFLHNSLVG